MSRIRRQMQRRIRDVVAERRLARQHAQPGPHTAETELAVTEPAGGQPESPLTMG